MSKCVCCLSEAIQIRDGCYHCDWCAKEYDSFEDYIEEGYRPCSAEELSGYLGAEYKDNPECVPIIEPKG